MSKENNNNNKTNLIGIDTQFGANSDGVFIKKTQDIPNWHMNELKEQRNESTKKREGEFMKVASIPTIVAEQWMKQGYNIYEMTGKEIVKKLNEDNLQDFFTTDKRIH